MPIFLYAFEKRAVLYIFVGRIRLSHKDCKVHCHKKWLHTVTLTADVESLFTFFLFMRICESVLGFVLFIYFPEVFGTLRAELEERMHIIPVHLKKKKDVYDRLSLWGNDLKRKISKVFFNI